MKKYYTSVLILISVVSLSGCSLMPTTQDGQGGQGVAVSPSVWKSTDGGRSWTVKNIASEKPQSGDWDVLRIVINPVDPNNIFVGLRNGGMMMSTDGGERWQPTIFTSEKVYGLEINPQDGRTLYVSGVYNDRGKIFKSMDRGENWEEIYTSATDGPLVVAMKLDKNNPETIYAATSDNLLLKSRDGGGSWRNMQKFEMPIIQIEIDRNVSDLVYVLDDKGDVFRSSNASETFERITPGESISMSTFSSGKIGAIKLDPGINGGIYAVGQDGIARSNNAGSVWERVSALNDTETSPVTALAINPRNSTQIIYGSSQAVYNSIDGGFNWASFQFDVSKNINIIEYDPVNPDVVWASFRK